MNAIEIVLWSTISFITLIIGGFAGRRIGITIGLNLRKTDHFIYKSYPTLRGYKKAGMREDEIVSNFLKDGNEKQVEELLKFWEKYESRRAKTEVKQFKEQFKDEPIGKKIVESLPFKD